MYKLRWLAGLMGITILGVTAFQLYWLKENLDRERKSLAIKSDMAFRQTMLQLQVSRLKLNVTADTGTRGNVRVFITDNDDKIYIRPRLGKDMVSAINVIRDKYNDSVRKAAGKGGVVVSMSKTTSMSIEKDSLEFKTRMHGPGPDPVLRFLSGVDSLQDSLRVKDIDSAYRRSLEKTGISIPFTIERDTTEARSGGDENNQVTVGFTHPVTYKVNTGNITPYLLRRLAMPMLFSVLLLGITILSFVLLYKSVLKQRRLAALKNEFISNITHELKTPIATVGVAIEALKNFNALNDPARTREYLDISTNELHRLGLLVDKVLKLSMFENKGIDLKYEPVNIRDIADDVAGSLKLQLEKYHARLDTRFNGDLQVTGDKLHLQSVIFNLVDNALKYRKDNPEILISATGNADEVVLVVKDNGIGIAPEYKDKIFEKFFRVPHGDTHNAKGYGLGLSYVARVVEGHRGTITVNSQPGEGTAFTITLPKNRS